MVRDEKLKKRWNILLKKISDQFNNGEVIDLDGIVYLIGILLIIHMLGTNQIKKEQRK